MPHDSLPVTPAEEDILLYLLTHGNNSPSNIGEAIDKNPSYVSQILPELEERCLVENIGRGVWALTADGVVMAQAVYREKRT